MTHITIKLMTGQEVVWPVERVHLLFTEKNLHDKCRQNDKYELVSPEMVMYPISKEEYKRVQALLTHPLITFDHPPCEMHCEEAPVVKYNQLSKRMDKLLKKAEVKYEVKNSEQDKGHRKLTDESDMIYTGDTVRYLRKDDNQIPFGTLGTVIETVSQSEDGTFCYEVEFEIDCTTTKSADRYVNRSVYSHWLECVNHKSSKVKDNNDSDHKCKRKR